MRPSHSSSVYTLLFVQVDPPVPDQFCVLRSTWMSLNLLLSLVHQCQAVGKEVLLHVVVNSILRENWKHGMGGPCVGAPCPMISLRSFQIHCGYFDMALKPFREWIFCFRQFRLRSQFCRWHDTLPASLCPLTPTQFLFWSRVSAISIADKESREGRSVW